jgi:hypothetical protein
VRAHKCQECLLLIPSEQRAACKYRTRAERLEAESGNGLRSDGKVYWLLPPNAAQPPRMLKIT